MTISLLLGLLYITKVFSYSCNSNKDCELLGTCTNDICVCKPGWTGPSCGTLKLSTAPNPNLGIWPLTGSHENNITYSWGFTIVKPINPAVDNTYHAWVNQGCYNTSMGMVAGCFLLHVTSTSPTNNFVAQEIMVPASSFNPHIIYSKLSKQYLMFFRINDVNSGWPVCIGNETMFKSKMSSTINNLTANSMDIAVSNNPYGPWYVDTITIANMPGTHISNPSGIQLDNGTFVMAYRFNTNAEHVGIAVSQGTDYKGPYYNIANFSVPGEDPFLWIDQNDGAYHVIFHVENGQAYSAWPSLHAWSTNLYDWNVSKSYQLFGEGAYSTNITWTDNTVTTFYRRERPEIMFDDNGSPLYFYTAVQELKTPNETGFPYSYSVVQDIAA